MRKASQAQKNVADEIVFCQGFFKPFRPSVGGSSQLEGPGIGHLDSPFIDNSQVDENRPKILLQAEEPVLQKSLIAQFLKAEGGR